MHKIKEYRNSLANNPDNEVYKNNSLIIDSCFSSTLEIIEEVFSSDELKTLDKYKLPVSFKPETVGEMTVPGVEVQYLLLGWLPRCLPVW